MKKEQWEYKISSGFTGVILSLIMLTVFGGITVWMHTSKNGAVIFGMILTAIAVVAFLIALYRAIFYKILIGEDGFFYQTNPCNGRYYYYSEIASAWTSSGRELNGYNSNYCNYETIDGEVVRFPFYPADCDAVDYLIERVEAKAVSKIGSFADDNREYRINGKVNGKTSIVAALVLLAVFVVLAVSFIQYREIALSFVTGIIMAAAILIILVVRYFCLKVQIGSTGFYFRSNPFNGKFYKYSDIRNCKEIKKVYRHRRYRSIGIGGFNRLYYFYFAFTDKNGKTRKFQFEKPIYEHEINVLKARIENAKH